MEGFISEFARQGLGYLIAVLEAGVILFLLKRLDGKDKVVENRDLIIQTIQEKRLAENKEYLENFLSIGRDVSTGLTGLKEATASITRFIETISWKKKK